MGGEGTKPGGAVRQQQLNCIVRLLGRLLDASGAFILVPTGESWTVAATAGLLLSEAQAISATHDILPAADWQALPDFTATPLAKYVFTLPLLSPGGDAVGRFCAVDATPRQLGASARGSLADLAQLAVSALVDQRPARERESLDKLSDASGEMLSQSEARFRGTFENAAVGMAHVDREGRWLLVNERLLDILGYTREVLFALTVADISHPEDFGVDRVQFARLWDGEIQSYQLEKRYFRADGSSCWVNLTVGLQRDACGTPLYAISTVEDINLRKAAEERQRLLIGEINHRVKNTLATIQSIASHTLRRVKRPEEFMDTFFARLQALSVAHDLLTQTAWEGASLADMIYGQAILADKVLESRVHCDGPVLIIPPQIALNLAMIFHELAANAVEYGGLSNDQGRLEVSWVVEAPATDGGHPHLALNWNEYGGPPPCVPDKAGFGSLLLGAGLEKGLGGKANLTWKPCGLKAEIKLPIPEYARRKELFRL